MFKKLMKYFTPSKPILIMSYLKADNKYYPFICYKNDNRKNISFGKSIVNGNIKYTHFDTVQEVEIFCKTYIKSPTIVENIIKMEEVIFSDKEYIL